MNKKIDAHNRHAFWPDEYQSIRDYSGSRLNIVLWPSILKAYMEAKGFITEGPPSYENTILFIEEKLGNHDIPLEFKYSEKIMEFCEG